MLELPLEIDGAASGSGSSGEFFVSSPCEIIGDYAEIAAGQRPTIASTEAPSFFRDLSGE